MATLGLTNVIAVDRLLRRLTLLGGMAGFLLVALAIPQAFTGAGAAFGIAYLFVVLIHFGMFARLSHLTVVQAIVGLAPFNLSTALLVLAGGVVGGTAQYVIWAIAFVGMWVSPKLTDDSGFEIQPGHFVERHGLVVIIAIGESIVAVGVGAAGSAIDLNLILAAGLGLALTACLWWSHFGADEAAADQRMHAAPMRDRPRLAIDAFGYCHLLLLLGILAIASALKASTGDLFGELESAKALALGGGVAVFLIGEALFRRTLGLGGARPCALAAVPALATVPLGASASAAAQLVVTVGVLVAMLTLTGRERARGAGHAAGPLR